MSIGDKLRQQDQVARRNRMIQWVVSSAMGLAILLFLLFYFFLPMWRGTP